MYDTTVKYHLGLDLGTNSIGWAAVILDGNGEPGGLLDMGVRIFPDGRDEQNSQSNAVDRRVARGQRRRRDRYLTRQSRLLDKLVECGLMPDDESARKLLEGEDPYTLRTRALDAPLKPFLLGRALFHLNQRRGFKSNRKAARTDADDKEGANLRPRIANLRQRMEESGARTLGEYLHTRLEKSETVRARPGQDIYPDRAMYEDEFNAIRKAQEPHHSISAGQWDNLRHIIFYQRDLLPVKPGLCQFEEGEDRADKALPVFQEFRLLQEVNNLRLSVGAEPERPLNEQERERVLQHLRSGKEIKLSDPSKSLKLPQGAVFNLAAAGRKSIEGDATTAKLANAGSKATAKQPKPALFGKKWLDFSLDERNEIVHFLLDTEDSEDVRQRAVRQWGLTCDQADAVANASLPKGYGNLSEKAIRKLLPHLEKGLSFYDAVKDAGYEPDFRNDEAHDTLPYYGQVLPQSVVGADSAKDPELDGETARYGRIANPTVHIGLNQLRRVVNLLIQHYGKPEEIAVELARDLKMNREQKQEYARQQREGANRNKRFREMLESAELEVTAYTLRKLRLWEEQGPPQARVCPYTGKQLSFEMVMSAQTEIDHILPFSRTLDNSMSNMVVCLAGANRVKGDQTPYEAFREKALEHVDSFPKNKRDRFRDDAMERFENEDQWLDRQLNETQYLSRTARTYLAYLYDEKGEGRQRVRAIPGRMTALLRRGWGLEGMLDVREAPGTSRKSRDDHRHHAVDAFVVANTTQGLLKQFAKAAASGNADAAEGLAKLVPKPWPDFQRGEVEQRIRNVVVSYKPDHGTPGVKGQTSGQLHNETAYGLIEPLHDGRHKVVHRKALSDFSANDIKAVRDEALRDALQNLWKEMGGDTKKFAKRAASEGVLVNGSRRRVRRARITDTAQVITIKDWDGKPYKGYSPGSNEFAEVWRMPTGKWQTVIVSTFEANQPGFNAESKRPHPAAKRLFRLQKDDTGAMGEGPDRRIVRVRQMDNNTSGPRVVLDDHNEANVDKRIREDTKKRATGEIGRDSGMKVEVFSATKLQRLGFRKVYVDEIGRVRDQGPFKP